MIQDLSEDFKGLEFSEVCSALSMVIFCPEPPMIVVQAARVLVRALEKTGIVDDYGKKIKQEYLVDDFKTIKEASRRS